MLDTLAAPVRLEPVDGGLALVSPYHAELVAGIKALPYSARKWDAGSRRWIIDPTQADTVVQLVQQHFNISLSIPQTIPNPSTPVIRMVELEYLGACKQRPSGPNTATGFANGSWSLSFPETVLRAWFQDPLEPTTPEQPAAAPKAKTLYTVLAVAPTAGPDEIKKAYRQLARQWHPDTCREPDTRERFEQIKAAYDVLGDPLKRRRYAAGLQFEASLSRPPGPSLGTALRSPTSFFVGYRAPLRCGRLLLEALPGLGQLTVTKVLLWEDITNTVGQTLVTSWPAGATMFIKEWV